MLLIGVGDLQAHFESLKWHSSDGRFEQALNKTFTDEDWSVSTSFEIEGVEGVALRKAKEFFSGLKVLKFEALEVPKDETGILY